MRALALAFLLAAACNPPCAIDPGIDAESCAVLTQMALPETLPPSPTNLHADEDATAKLGFHIYYDARFSENHKVRCATCHAPETHFDDSHAVATAIGTGTRNAPSVLGVAWRTRSFLWDGRADVLWAPPIGAIENPLEMGFSRLEIARAVQDYYTDTYTPIFGALPDLSALPDKGKPGDAAFDQMSKADQDAVNRVASNVGKALEAYMRKLATGPSAFDRYLAGDHTALSVSQQLGMLLFVKSGCASCHGGPLFADGKFHNLGVPGDPAAPDLGRAPGVELERAQLFSPSGPFSDHPEPLTVADATPADVGAFRTPSLRNVAQTAPYMHNGQFATLGDAVDFHLQGGGRGQAGVTGEVDAQLTAHPLPPGDRAALLDFLAALDGSYPAPPWNDWPDRP